MPHLGIVGKAHDLLHERLATVVGRMRLAGDHELHRPVGVEQDPLEPLRVAQHQGESFVRRHAAREPDGADVRVEHALDPAELCLTRAALQPRRAQPATDLVDEPRAQGTPGGPDPCVGHLVDGLPAGRRLDELGADLLLGQVEDLARHPGGRVHAVGDRGDRYVGRVEAGPQAFEHPAAHGAVQLRDAVGPLRQPQPHHGHIEDIGIAVVVRLSPQVEHPLDRNAGTGVVAAEIRRDQLAREAVDAGRHRRVRREDRPGPHGDERLVEGQALDSEFSDALEAEEARVSLVGVEHLGRRCVGRCAVGPQRADAADTEQHLLQQPVLGAAAVQPVGDLTFGRRVGLDVGVQQQQRDAADLRHPDLRREGAARWQADGHG